MASSADLELLWTRIEVEIDLPHAPTRPAAVRGVSKLWVLPTALKPKSSVRLHCRQCKVTGVTVNGAAAAAWECLDPHACVVHDPRLAGDGEALETFARAAFLAAHDGELLVRLPALQGPSSRPGPRFALPDELTTTAAMAATAGADVALVASAEAGGCGVGGGAVGSSISPSPSPPLNPRAAESRARCLSAMRARLAACALTHGKPLLIEVSFPSQPFLERFGAVRGFPLQEGPVPPLFLARSLCSL